MRLARMPHALLCLILLGLMAGCGGTGAVVPDTNPDEAVSSVSARGRIITQSLMATWSVDELDTTLSAYSPALSGIARYPISVYKLVYETIDPSGNKTRASGTLAVPQVSELALPIASYQHATAVMTTYAERSGEVRIIPLILASTGYVAVLPDYLGLGASPGLHPYSHAHSLATAVVDMIRAARAFSVADDIALNGQVFLLGYSEGGYATMAAHRAIESDYADEITVTASAPMAGPYDLSGTMASVFLSDAENEHSYYLAYFLLAYNRVYHLADSLASIFTSEIAQALPILFDGVHTSQEINAQLPLVPSDMLNPTFAEALRRDPEHPLWRALAENDLYKWRPLAPMRLYHCSGDEQVPVENSQKAYESMIAAGARAVDWVDLEVGGHVACAGPSIYQAKLWFDSLESVK